MIKFPLVFFILLNTNLGLNKSHHVKHGIASIYARSLEGSPTTSGDVFSHKKLTAASNNFKLGARVLVKNLKTGKSVIVKINDRMAHRMSRMGRIVDLSLAAAHKIGFSLKQGLIRVEVSEVF
jgi:rare lipoprotein A